MMRGAICAAFLFAAALYAAPASGQEPEETPEVSSEADREAEMFGSPEDRAPDREAQMFGEPADASPAPPDLDRPVLTDTAIDARLDQAQDKLALGAFAFLRTQYAVLEEGAPETFRLSTPALVDVYLDGRPNDRVRGYVRGRLATDFSTPEGATDLAGEEIERTTARLDQLWLKFDMWRAVFVTAGKQRIKWGTGRFWNPSDFLNNEQLDPLEVAVFDDRLGVSLLKVHVPVESLGWNFYGIATLDGAQTPEDVGGAVRAEFLYGFTELALSTALRKNNPLRFAADLSTGVWLFDLRLEAAVLYDDERPYYRGDFALPSTFPDEYSRSEDVIPQLVAGAEIQIQYSDEDVLFVGAEYFFNDAGYDSAELYPWLFANQRFTPFYVGRHYAALYAVLPAPGTWNDTSFVLSGLGNLSDRSFITRLDISQTVLTYLRWNVFGNVHFGDIGEFRYRLAVDPNPLLPDGLQIAAPLFEVGAGLQLSL